MDALFLGVVGVIALALLFDFTNGFHDAANSVATVVATRAMPARVAVWFSAACNFAAYFFVGTAVADTVAKTVDVSEESLGVVFAALFAAVAWNYLTWYLGLPSSSSHAIIGGLVGAGIAVGGVASVNWGSVTKTVLAIVVSPLVAFGIAGLGTLLVRALRRGADLPEDSPVFRWLQLASAAAVSFGHGANDAQKTMGVIAALLAGAGYGGVTIAADGTLPVPEWVALGAYVAIALGTAWGGWRIIETMGMKVTAITPPTAVAANIGAVTSIFGATALGVPISTTHAAASSVAGAGAASGSGVNWRVMGRMAVAWVTTIPAAVAIGWTVCQTTRLPTAAAAVGVTVLVLALGTFIVVATRRAVGAHHELDRRLAAEAEAATEAAAATPESVAGGSARADSSV